VTAVRNPAKQDRKNLPRRHKGTKKAEGKRQTAEKKTSPAISKEEMVKKYRTPFEGGRGDDNFPRCWCLSALCSDFSASIANNKYENSEH
jgi:hypothetical protein